MSTNDHDHTGEPAPLASLRRANRLLQDLTNAAAISPASVAAKPPSLPQDESQHGNLVHATHLATGCPVDAILGVLEGGDKPRRQFPYDYLDDPRQSVGRTGGQLFVQDRDVYFDEGGFPVR